MKAPTADRRLKRIDRDRKNLVDAASNQELEREMRVLKSEIDDFMNTAHHSIDAAAGASVNCGLWADRLVACGVYAALTSPGEMSLRQILSAAHYRLGDMNLRYLVARFQGDVAPAGHVGSYVQFCHGFLSVVCVGSKATQDEFAKVLLLLGEDGVRDRAVEEPTYAAYAEAVANCILKGSLEIASFSKIDGPFARLVEAASRGGDLSRYVTAALDHHMFLSGGDREGGKFSEMNYPSLGFSIFPAPVLAGLRLAGVDPRGIDRSAHPLVDLETFRINGRVEFDPDTDATLRKVLRERFIGANALHAAAPQ
jgi:hypothetical protein